MVMLDICGSLKAFKTFKQPFGRWNILRWVPHYDSAQFSWLPQMLGYTRSMGKTDYNFLLWIAHLRGTIRRWFLNAIPKPFIAYLKKLKYPYWKDPFNPCKLDINQ